MSSAHFLGDFPVITRYEDFDRRSGSLPERILFNNRSVVLLVCAVVTVVLGLFATKLQLNARPDRMIPLHHPYVGNFVRHREELHGLANVVRIAVKTNSGTILSARYLETLRKINDEVFLVPGVDRPYLKSLWTPSTLWFSVTEEGLEGGPVIPDDYDGSPRSLAQIRAAIEQSGEIGHLVATDFKSAALVVPLLDRNPSTGQPLDHGEVARALEAIRTKYQSPDTSIYITGYAKVVGDLIAGVGQMLRFFALSVLITLGFLLLYTRSLRNALLVVGCSLVAVIAQLGLLRVLGQPLSPYSVLVPFLIFAIGVSHGTQKMNGIAQDIGRGTHKLVAARYTFRRLFLPGVTALLAAAAGFAVLMFIDIPAIHDLALAATLGIGMLVFTNLVMLPILLSYVGVNPRAALRSSRAEPADELGEGGRDRRRPRWLIRLLGPFSRRRPATIALAVAAALATAAGALSLRLQVGDLGAGAPELRADSRYNRDNAFFNTFYAASSDVLVVMVETAPYQCAGYDTLVRTDALEWRLQSLPGVRSTSSLAGLAKRFAVGMNEGHLAWYDLARDQQTLNAAAARAPRELVNDVCSLLTLRVFLEDHKADTLSRVVKEVEAFAAGNDGPQRKVVLTAGDAGFAAVTNIVIERAHFQTIVLVYLVVLALCFVTFRSWRSRQAFQQGWRAVCCAALPLALTSIMCEALMVVLGIGVKVATLPVIAVGVGVGVDYTLYVLSVMLAGIRQGMSLGEAHRRTLLFTGKVVLLAGAILAAAVSVWFFSPIKFQADMGVLLAFMFVWNMLGTLILVPAFAHFLLQTPRFKRSAEPPPTRTRDP